MAKLHEVLAIEADLEGKAKRIIEEATNTFKSKPHLFQGKLRTLSLFAGDDEVSKSAAEAAERQEQVLVTTVQDKLAYLWESLIGHWNAVAQKEATNQTAKADIVVNGVTLLTDVPVTLLLSLESKLKLLRGIYEVVPTLEPNIHWTDASDVGPNVKRAPETKTLKTAKVTDYKTVAAPTDKHPAQVVQVQKDVNVGAYTQSITSGLITPAQKSVWLARIDDLLRSVKQARQRANEAQLVTVRPTELLMKYIHNDDLANANSSSAA